MKKLISLFLALTLILGMIPTFAFAEGETACVTHIPGGEKYPANYTVCGGGYEEAHYGCNLCGEACDIEGNEIEWLEPTNGHTWGEEPKLAVNENKNSCSGYYTEDYFECSVCEDKVIAVKDENGEFVCGNGYPNWKPTEGDIHTPGEISYPADSDLSCKNEGGYATEYYICKYCQEACDKNGKEIAKTFEHTANLDDPREADYTECGGGFRVEHYECSECYEACDKDGNEFTREEGTKKHTPGNEIHNGDYTDCGGGMKDYYICKVCGWECNVDGTSAEWQEPEDDDHDCGKEPKLAEKEKENSCQGWYEEDYFECTLCKSAFGVAVDEDGNTIPGERIEKIRPEWEKAKHTPGSKNYPANYTECGGGFEVDYYECTECYESCNVNGVYVERTEGTGEHTAGSEVIKANYTPCGGGIDEDFYVCTECDADCDADGKELRYKQGDGKHTPGSKKYPANYTECNGGITEDYYVCKVCRNSVNAEGKDASWGEPKEGAKHTHTGEVNEANYIKCSGGFKENYYYCKDCDQPTDINGESVEWFDRDKTAKHTPGNEIYTGDYTECGGGFKEGFYICTKCEAPCDKDGNELTREKGTIAHTPGDEKYTGDYTHCGGGMEDYYICTVCEGACNENGTSAEWQEPEDDDHKCGKEIKLAEKEKENSCQGWYKEDYFECSTCKSAFEVAADKEGDIIPGEYIEKIWPKEEEAKHTPGSERHSADYTESSGGFKEEYYICTECGAPCKADGSWIEYNEGTVIFGDVSGDGKVTVRDAMLIYDFCNGKHEFSEGELYAADLTGDGNVDKADAERLYWCLNNSEENFKVE